MKNQAEKITNDNIKIIENLEFRDKVVRIKKKHDLVEITNEFKIWLKYIKKELKKLEKYNNYSTV